MFQQMSEIDIVQKVLGEWGVSPVLRLAGKYKKRKYRVQYGESDYTFICRLLEDAGVSFYFEGGGELVLDDGPQRNAPRAPLAFRDHPTQADLEHVTAVRVGRRLRPGAYTVRDHDHRRPPSYPLMARATGGAGVEGRLERFHYAPGAFLFESAQGNSTPHADDKGKYRTDEGDGAALARRRLDAERGGAKGVTFKTSAMDPAPGTVLSFLDHPKSELDGVPPALVERRVGGRVELVGLQDLRRLRRSPGERRRDPRAAIGRGIRVDRRRRSRGVGHGRCGLRHGRRRQRAQSWGGGGGLDAGGRRGDRLGRGKQRRRPKRGETGTIATGATGSGGSTGATGAAISATGKGSTALAGTLDGATVSPLGSRRRGACSLSDTGAGAARGFGTRGPGKGKAAFAGAGEGAPSRRRAEPPRTSAPGAAEPPAPSSPPLSPRAAPRRSPR